MEGDLPKKELFKDGVSPPNTLMGSFLVRATRLGTFFSAYPFLGNKV